MKQILPIFNEESNSLNISHMQVVRSSLKLLSFSKCTNRVNECTYLNSHLLYSLLQGLQLDQSALFPLWKNHFLVSKAGWMFRTVLRTTLSICLEVKYYKTVFRTTSLFCVLQKYVTFKHVVMSRYGRHCLSSKCNSCFTMAEKAYSKTEKAIFFYQIFHCTPISCRSSKGLHHGLNSI